MPDSLLARARLLYLPIDPAFGIMNAEALAQSVAATAQSRASAAQFNSQADKLSGLVPAFRIETPST